MADTVTIRKGDKGIFDIETDGRVVGGGSMIEAESADDFCYLERIDIDEEHRNKGYGTAALKALRDIYGGYCLAPDNADAQRLYERVADEMRDADYDKFGFAIDQGFGVYEY